MKFRIGPYKKHNIFYFCFRHLKLIVCFWIDLLATNKWIIREMVCQHKDGSILHSQCGAKVDLSFIISYYSYFSCCNVAFFWRHLSTVWSIWNHSFGFHFTNAVLQCNFQTIQTKPYLLYQHIHSYSLFNFSSYWRRCLS